MSFACVLLTATAADGVAPGSKGLAYGVFQTATHVGSAVALAVLATASAARTRGALAAGGGHAAALASGLRLAYLLTAALALLGALGTLALARREVGQG